MACEIYMIKNFFELARIVQNILAGDWLKNYKNAMELMEHKRGGLGMSIIYRPLGTV
ncbi:MAG: hypothetical protein Fur0010_15310 [Bdellovibrio sp.]